MEELQRNVSEFGDARPAADQIAGAGAAGGPVDRNCAEVDQPKLDEGEPTEGFGAEEAEGDGALNLLHRLDRRQNEVLTELDRLNAAIEQLVRRCQDERVRDEAA